MIDKINKYLNNIDAADLKNGFVWNEEIRSYTCIFCEEMFEDGIIYPIENTLYIARRAIEYHCAHVHGGVFAALLELGSRNTGISDIQQSIVKLIYQGYTDTQIAASLGKSPSTIRNHRFLLRKRVREAKLFSAIMALVEQYDKNSPDFLDFHADITTRDDRMIVTEQEAAEIVSHHFRQEKGALTLTHFPRKQKVKLVILNRISELFTKGRQYTEKEVNAVIAAVYGDYVTIRRYLIDYGFLDRKADGSRYWLK